MVKCESDSINTKREIQRKYRTHALTHCEWHRFQFNRALCTATFSIFQLKFIFQYFFCSNSPSTHHIVHTNERTHILSLSLSHNVPLNTISNCFNCTRFKVEEKIATVSIHSILNLYLKTATTITATDVDPIHIRLAKKKIQTKSQSNFATSN